MLESNIKKISIICLLIIIKWKKGKKTRRKKIWFITKISNLPNDKKKEIIKIKKIILGIIKIK